MPNPEPIKIEINGTLDLHQFNPKDTSELINEFISACHKKEYTKVKLSMVWIGIQRENSSLKIKS